MNDKEHWDSKDFIKNLSEQSQDASNEIAIYVVLRILNEIKTQLGLESMLIYIQKYIYKIENSEPDLKEILSKALQSLCIEKLFKRVV